MSANPIRLVGRVGVIGDGLVLPLGRRWRGVGRRATALENGFRLGL